MTLLLDFLPLLLFFATFKYAGSNPDWASAFATEHLGALVSGGVVGPQEAPALLATVVVIAATAVQVVLMKATRRPVPAMLWVSLAMVAVLGALTVWFHSETFIKWKPTAVYWLLAAALLGGQWLAGKNPIRSLLGAQLTLPDAVWSRLNLSWGLFFAVLGVANIAAAYLLSTAAWVNIKVFGFTAALLLFVVAQSLALAKYLPKQAEEPKP